MKGQDLPVQVRQRDPVRIDQVQGTDPTAGQCFRGIAAHTAEAENGDPAVLQTLQSFLSQKHFGSCQLMLHLSGPILRHSIRRRGRRA